MADTTSGYIPDAISDLIFSAMSALTHRVLFNSRFPVGFVPKNESLPLWSVEETEDPKSYWITKNVGKNHGNRPFCRKEGGSRKSKSS